MKRLCQVIGWLSFLGTTLAALIGWSEDDAITAAIQKAGACGKVLAAVAKVLGLLLSYPLYQAYFAVQIHRSLIDSQTRRAVKPATSPARVGAEVIC